MLRLVLFRDFLRFEDFKLAAQIFRFVVERRLNDLAFGVDLVQAFPAGLQETEFRLFQTDDGFQTLQFRVLGVLRRGRHRGIASPPAAAAVRLIATPRPQSGNIGVPLRFLRLDSRKLGADPRLRHRSVGARVRQHPRHLLRCLGVHRRQRRARHVPVACRQVFKLVDGVGKFQLLLRVNEVQQISFAFNKACVNVPCCRLEVVKLFCASGYSCLQFDHRVVDFDTSRAEFVKRSLHFADGGIVLGGHGAGFCQSFGKGHYLRCCVLPLFPYLVFRFGGFVCLLCRLSCCLLLVVPRLYHVVQRDEGILAALRKILTQKVGVFTKGVRHFSDFLLRFLCVPNPNVSLKPVCWVSGHLKLIVVVSLKLGRNGSCVLVRVCRVILVHVLLIGACSLLLSQGFKLLFQNT